MKAVRLFTLIAMLASSASLALAQTSSYDTTILSDQPVSYWPMQETTGPIVHDIISSNNGTLFMGTVPGPGGQYYQTWVTNDGSAFGMGGPGILNNVPTDKAVYFTNANHTFIQVPYANNLNAPRFSTEGWIRTANYPIVPQPNGAYLGILGFVYNHDPPNYGWQCYIDATTAKVSTWEGYGGDWYFSTAQAQYKNQWIYTTLTYDGTNFNLYVNGSLILGTNKTYAPIIGAGTNTATFLMGAVPAQEPPVYLGWFFQGAMSHIAYYNYALSTNQIMNHYTVGTQGGSPPPPIVLTPPANQTNYVTQTATFTVGVGGTSPFYYQWLAGAVGSGIYTNLIEGGQFSPVTNVSLSISNLNFGNAADFVVVITNLYGSTTSSPARLTVLDGTPFITVNPKNQTNYVGQTAGFTVGAGGLPPLSYQWQGGATGSGIYTNLVTSGQISSVTNAALTIANLTLGNSADYRVVVTNLSGSITSSAASLIVQTNPPVLSYTAAVLADHPVAYWPLQETIGPVIHDVVGTNNGTLFTSVDGAVLTKNQHTNFVTAGAVATDGLTYFLGGPGALTGVGNDAAIYFTNRDVTLNNSDIVIPYNAAYDPASTFTAEAWVKVPTYPVGYTQNNYQTVFGLEANSGGTQNGWWMNLQTDNVGTSKGAFQFNLAKPPGAGWNSPASPGIFSGQWVHAVEVCVGGTNMICYTNGVQMFNTTWPTNNYMSEGAYGTHKLPFVIGSYCVSYGAGVATWGFERGNFWHGGVSHVAIYTNALSINQVLAHYQSRTNSPAPSTPVISIQASGGNLVVSWTAGSLQQAASLTDVWTDITNTSPYTAGPTNATMFFRAKN